MSRTVRGAAAQRVLRLLAPAPTPLHRTSDRVGVALRVALVLVALLGLLAVPRVQVQLHQRLVASAAARLEHREPVDAVLLADAPGAGPAVAADGLVATGPGASAVAAWTGSDGVTTTDRVPVKAGARAGEVVRVWVAPDVAPLPDPRPDDLEAQAVAATTGAVLAWLGLVAAAHLAFGQLLARHHDRSWDADWELTGPRWTGRG